MSDADLVAKVLKKPAAAGYAILEFCDGLRGLGRATPHELSERVSAVTAGKLAAAIELGRRVTLAQTEDPECRIGNAEAVAKRAIPRIGVLDHEELWVLCLDGRN